MLHIGPLNALYRSKEKWYFSHNRVIRWTCTVCASHYRLRCVCHPNLHISHSHKQPNHILSSTWVPPNVISLHNWIGTRRLLVCALIWIVPLAGDIVFKDSPVNTYVFRLDNSLGWIWLWLWNERLFVMWLHRLVSSAQKNQTKTAIL